MDLISPKIIKDLLSKYETKPSKGLGQNFLIDRNILNKIVDSADIKPEDIVLEVGPGLGTLTQELAQRAKQIIAVEKDDTMIEVLKETLKDFNNVEVINTDILGYKLQVQNYKVVANIPYYLTSPLIRKFLEDKNQPTEIILMVQKEVAQRICSIVPKMNLLAVSVQFYATPKIISYVSKSCFWPSPNVDSAIIKITPRGPSSTRGGRASTDSPENFFKVVKAGFSHPRKQLQNNFGVELKMEKDQVAKWLMQNNIKPNQRAQTLSIEDWISLTKTYEF
jgi:16S rRNA (adenine1518-N6/adenine1519-N6)-dimethyltransferase